MSASQRMSTDEALKMLQEGNRRFREGKATHPRQDQMIREKTATEGQQPYAAVLTCSDSRVPAEILFDAGIGDLFPIENAGNHLSAETDQETLGYAVAHLNVPAVVVLGHTACGAVTHTVNDGEGLPKTKEALSPAAKNSKDKAGDAVQNAIEENVRLQVSKINQFIQKWGKADQCKAVGFCYDIKTGEVEQISPRIPENNQAVAKT